MKGTGAGWNSCLYRVLIAGGFVAVIGGTVFTSVTQPSDSKLPLYVGVGGVSILMVLIVGYWIVQIIFKGYGSMRAPDLTQKPSAGDLSILQSWDRLFSAMVTDGGDPERMNQSARKGNSTLRIWFLWAVVVALCPIAMMVPYALGLVEWSQVRYAVLIYIGIVIAMSIFSLSIVGKSAKATEDVMLAPLGLKLTDLPNVVMAGGSPLVRGATVIEGTRFGRAVRITLGVGPGTTQVAYSAPALSIKSRSGDLEAERGAPEPVHEALRGLRKAKRWEGIAIAGDKSGITITRKNKGQNLWLYDLWLIERIITRLEGPGGPD